MSEQDILNTLESIKKDLRDIKETLLYGYNITSKKSPFRQRFFITSLKDPEIRTAIMKLKKEGRYYKDIVAYIQENWPDHPEKHPSKSTIQRFYQAAKFGAYREYGVEALINI